MSAPDAITTTSGATDIPGWFELIGERLSADGCQRERWTFQITYPPSAPPSAALGHGTAALLGRSRRSVQSGMAIHAAPGAQATPSTTASTARSASITSTCPPT